MTRPTDKRHEPDTSSAHENLKGTPRTAPDPKDPDVYDPVGMAGKKAGIVEEVARQLDAERQEEDDVDPTVPIGNEHSHDPRKEHPGSPDSTSADPGERIARAGTKATSK